MTVRSVVCVILIRSLVVAAYPTSDNDGDPLLIELPVSGVAEFSGTAPATGSVAIVGHAPCPEFLLPSPSNPNTPILTKALENDEACTLTEFDEPSPPKFQANDEINSNDPIPKKVILGAILADSFMAEKGAEIDAKLAEFDAFVEKELGTVGPIIQTALVNADTSEIDSNVDSTILEMESEISSELTMIDEFMESELAETEELIESVNAENVSAEKDPGIELELAMLESFVESSLEKSEALIESELEKVNSLVESELAKVDSVVESELHSVDLFVERELAKTNAVKSELSKMESIVVNELAKAETSMEDIADSITASSDPVCIISNSDGNDNEESNEDQIRTIAINGTFHVTGRTIIVGSTGCPSPFNTGEPLPLYVESFPVFETLDENTYEPEIQSEDIINDDGGVIELPIMGEALFSGVAPAVGTCRILGTCSCDSLLPSINSNISPPMVGDANPMIPLKQAGSYSKQYFTISENNEPNADADSVLYHKKQLPMVFLTNLKADQKPIGAVILKGNVEFSGNAEAFGGTRLSADFPCPELTASDEGPDGKKYIWIAKKPCNKDTPK